MPEKLKEKCCGQPASIERSAKTKDESGTEIHGVGIWCELCGNQSFHENEKTAIEMFTANSKPEPVQQKKETKPKNKTGAKPMNNVPALRKAEVFKNTAHLAEIASPIISSDKGALERLIRNNVRYVENSAALEKVWETPEGEQSIIHETEEAMIMGIEMGKMGDLVPFGRVCQLIPSVDAYDFVLTNGNNAPFEWIKIECIHEHDERSAGSKNGNFFIEIQKGIPRGDIIAVAVYGLYRKYNKVIGEIYDAERLMQKAEAHSISYQRYLQDVKYAEKLRPEGGLKEKYGREYFMKEIPKKNGGTWNKEVFLDEMSNPYDGPDRPEMLRKSAGKSFLGPYMKVRNSEAAMAEARTHEESRDSALKMAEDTISGEGEEV